MRNAPDISSRPGFPSPEGGLWLASKSPRRRQLLERAQASFGLLESGIDDAGLARGRVSPAEWVMSLAYLKAKAARDGRASRSAGAAGVVLGADTLCVLEGDVIGQPADADAALRIMRSFRNRPHEVVTGVALLCGCSAKRMLFVDESRVEWGDVPETEIERYVRSGAWQGKAGGYNLAERLEAGWDIRVEGDPDSIMGLPVSKLAQHLARFCDPDN